MTAHAVTKIVNCKSKSDIAGQSIDIEWHVCLGDTTVQILQKLRVFKSETRHDPENFLDRIIFASMLNEITKWESRKVQDKCRAQAKDVVTYAKRFRPGYWCCCCPGSEKPWK